MLLLLFLGDNSNCTKEEFVDFLSNLFKNVDDVDREGEITMKTAGSFRLIGDLIEILSAFGTIDEDWNKKSNILLKKRKILQI